MTKRQLRGNDRLPVPKSTKLRSDRLLDRTFSLWIKNGAPITLLAFLFNAPVLLFVGTRDSHALTKLAWEFSGNDAVIALLAAMGATAVACPIIVRVYAALHGGVAPLGHCLAEGLRRFPSCLGLTAIIALILTFLAIAANLAHQLVPVLPLFAAFIVGTLALLRSALAVPAAVVEHANPVQAIGRSLRLTKRAVRTSFWVLFLVTAILGGAVTIAGSFAAVLGTPTNTEAAAATLSIARIRASLLAESIVAIALLGLWPVSATVVYDALNQADTTPRDGDKVNSG